MAVTRRGFIGAMVAAVGALAMGKLPAMPSLKEEVIHIDWFRAVMDPHFMVWVEARWRREGGPWQKLQRVMRRADLVRQGGVVWLTPRTGVRLHDGFTQVEN